MISLFQFPLSLSLCINDRSFIECPRESKCFEPVVTMSGKMFNIKFKSVHSLITFLLSLSNILYVTFLISNEVNYI